MVCEQRSFDILLDSSASHPFLQGKDIGESIHQPNVGPCVGSGQVNAREK